MAREYVESRGTGKNACASEAGTGHGLDVVTEKFPVFVGCHDPTSHA